MKTVLHTFAALTLAATLAACSSDPAAETKSVDAEDYTAGVSVVATKRVDPEVTSKKKVQTTCKTRKSNGQCKTWNYKTETKVTDDTDYVLVLGNGYEVDVDQTTYDSYSEGDAYPRS